MKKRVNSQIVDQWVEKAESDLYNATIVVMHSDPPADTICFHCHQTAEKYVKAFLVANKVMFKKVHDLGYLLNLCLAIDPDFEELRDSMEVLNGYYIETRYPLDFPIYYSLKEANEAVDLAHRVKKFVRGKLGLE